jgi:hypothetical protein
VADALALVGALPRRVADAVTAELDDALAVRGHLPVTAFTGRPFPVEVAVTATPKPTDELRGAAAVWLEAEAERHLDVVVDLDPVADPAAGADALRIVGGAVRAFEAAGVLGVEARDRFGELGAALAAAGFDVGPLAGGSPPRSSWVDFLQRRPAALLFGDVADEVVEVRRTVGDIAGRTVSVSSLAWSPRILEVRLSVRTPPGAAPGDRAAWSVRVTDPGGQVHLGQPQLATSDGAAYVVVRLRPGFEELPSGTALDVRVVTGGDVAEATVVVP